MTLPGNAVGAGRAVTVGENEFWGPEPECAPGATTPGTDFSVGDAGAVALGFDDEEGGSEGFSLGLHAVTIPIPTSADAPITIATRRCARVAFISSSMFGAPAAGALRLFC